MVQITSTLLLASIDIPTIAAPIANPDNQDLEVREPNKGRALKLPTTLDYISKASGAVSAVTALAGKVASHPREYDDTELNARDPGFRDFFKKVGHIVSKFIREEKELNAREDNKEYFTRETPEFNDLD